MATVTANTSGAHKQLPPGPRGTFFFGVLPEFTKHTIEFLSRVAAEYGDVVHLPFGPAHVIFLNHPDHIKHVLQDNHRNYGKDQYTMNIIREWSGANIFTSDGEFWLKQRRTLQPAFHRQRVAGFGQAMTEAVELMLREWEQRPTGEYIDIEKEMMRVTLRVVGRTLFSVDLVEEHKALGHAFDISDRYVQFRLDNPYYLPRWVPTQLNREASWALKHSHETIMAMIAERRKAGHKEDLLSMLIEARDEDTGEGMSDEQVRREAVTIVAAGHETTATTLAWAFYSLSQNPAVEAQLHTELETVLAGRLPTMTDLPKLPYTRAVIDEALRLYPAAWATSREALGADEIGGYAIQPKWTVMVSPYVIQRDARYWDEPNIFKPERFLAEAPNRPKFAYMPFGGGPRLCIGQPFALAEATLILATVAQRYRLRLKPEHPVQPKPVFTLKTSHGLPMRLEAR